MNKKNGKLKQLLDRLPDACRNLWGIIRVHRTSVLFFVAFWLALISYTVVPTHSGLETSAARLEKQIQKRQAILEEYASRAMEIPVEEWLSFDDFPEDMVLYRYNADTLQSWVNQFPISNDEVDVLTLWYRMNHLNSRNLFNTPLAYLTDEEQYVNLGSAWYAVKVYRKDKIKVISGLLIKTEYLSNNTILTSKINERLKPDRKMILMPLPFDEGIVVKGKDGNVLFSVIEDVTAFMKATAAPVKWLSLLFLCAALYSFYFNKRTFRAYLIYMAGLTAIRYMTFELGVTLRYDSLLFSPQLYADEGLNSSLGNFLLNNFYIFMTALGLYLLRKRLIIRSSHSTRLKLILYRSGAVLCLLGLMCYIHYAFTTLINNSSIVLELYRLEELSVYSVLAYISYSLLFVALLLLLQLFAPWFNLFKKNSILTTRNLMVYLTVISLYTLFVVSVYGFRKEFGQAKVWVNKLSVERDISLEMQLRSIEEKLAADPIIMAMLNLPPDRFSLVQNRLEELYLNGVEQKYEIKLTVCRPGDMLLDNRWQQMVPCAEFYQGLLQNSVPLADKSNFFYLNNYSGRVSYLGVFRYRNALSGFITLYIELDSRYAKDLSGYSAVLFDFKPSDNVNMPSSYSYAKYIDNRLVVHRGGHVYPMALDYEKFEPGFSIVRDEKSVHFVNRSGVDNIIIISRERRHVYPYLVSFSYLMLFYAATAFLVMRGRRLSKKRIRIKLPKHSFRRKITYLITVSLVVSLICMGIGSVWFCISYYNDSNKTQMESRLHAVQELLADLCKYAENYNQINTANLFQSMDRMAKNSQTEINLYDPHGRLIRSTQPELFDRYLLSSRMNPEAYHKIITENRIQVINKEKLGELQYYSLYAPIFNASGKLIAIANLPYFAKGSDITGDVSSILAAIINIYILLLLAAIFGGTALSNQLSKPLAAISSKMKLIDVSKKAEHINYRNEDELGVLVGAYNKMVDDLEESTQRLAQTEREQAWSEMARQIAHEIKNPLTPMRLSIQHLVRMKQKGYEGWEDKFEDVASSILEQIDILSNTASEFSSFAKFYYEDNTVLNLAQIINEQRILFDTRDNIRISYDYCSTECRILARKGQIIRVIVNLVSNAIQALEERGGYIRITLKEVERNYLVSIEDNGSGVKDEDTDKLFKPNFTTKSSGTGLGLAICRNIIEQSNGRIFYQRSELGGANFSFFLPIYKG